MASTTNNPSRNTSDPARMYPEGRPYGTSRIAATDDLQTPPMRLQFGPSHPATHGTVRIMLDMDGEHVLDADVQVGYLHRGFEKECETGYYYQNIPYTDRLNYSSPILCNIAYCMAVEKLAAIEVTERCQYVRVLAGELSRIADHLLCIGASCLELAAMTPFLYLLEARELVWDLLDALCGSRVTTNYIRIGGVSADLPQGFAAFCRDKLDGAIKLLEDCEKLLTDNPIFRQRMEGTGTLAGQRAHCLRRHRSAAARGGRAPGSAPGANPTWFTIGSISTCRSANTATISTATWCGWKRSARAAEWRCSVWNR